MVHGSHVLMAKQRHLSHPSSITYRPEPRVQPAHALAMLSFVANSSPTFPQYLRWRKEDSSDLPVPRALQGS